MSLLKRDVKLPSIPAPVDPEIVPTSCHRVSKNFLAREFILVGRRHRRIPTTFQILEDLLVAHDVAAQQDGAA